MTESEQAPPGVDPTVPTPARLYNYYLGGTSYFPIDREVAEELRRRLPELSDAAWANRGFHHRAARWMAGEHGVRQFLDLGSGLPTRGTTHEAVRQLAPDARLVYVDNDPMVLDYARTTLNGTARTAVIAGDMREPEQLFAEPAFTELIDLTQPLGLLLTGVLQFVDDKTDPWQLMARYRAAMVPGSYVAISHCTADRLPPAAVQAIHDTYARTPFPMYLRSRAEVERLFEGFALVAPFAGAKPGLTFAGSWGAEDERAADSDGSRILYCGVARRT
jgi:O-methyltransferase involved in polyketide biosynthesis